jgi:hypothetical protein
MTVGLCSNADKLDARATDPKTRPQPRHAPHSGVHRRFSQEFRMFSPTPRSGSSFALIPVSGIAYHVEGVAPFGAANVEETSLI